MWTISWNVVIYNVVQWFVVLYTERLGIKLISYVLEVTDTNSTFQEVLHNRSKCLHTHDRVQPAQLDQVTARLHVRFPQESTQKYLKYALMDMHRERTMKSIQKTLKSNCMEKQSRGPVCILIYPVLFVFATALLRLLL